MQDQDGKRTANGWWQGPAADVFGSAMKSMITYVQGYVTALQPDPNNANTGWAHWLHTVADKHYEMGFYYDRWLDYYYNSPDNFVDSVLKNKTWGKWTLLSAAERIDKCPGQDVTTSWSNSDFYYSQTTHEDDPTYQQALDAYTQLVKMISDAYTINYEVLTGWLNKLRNEYKALLGQAIVSMTHVPPEPIFTPDPNLKDPTDEFNKKLDDQQSQFNKTLDDQKAEADKVADDAKKALDDAKKSADDAAAKAADDANKALDDAKAAADKQADGANKALDDAKAPADKQAGDAKAAADKAAGD